MNTAQDIIEHLELIPHPEGGFYKETYRNWVKIIVVIEVTVQRSTSF